MYTAKNEYVINSVTKHDVSILDVGCGTGSNAAEIKQRYPGSQIVGLNHDERELEIAQSFLECGHVVDLNHLPDDLLQEKFDLIICSHVLEHLIDPKYLVCKLLKNLKPDGRIILLVPNFGVWNARITVLLGRFKYEESGLFDRTHLRFFTYPILLNELLPEGLNVYERLAHGHFPLPLFRRFLPQALVAKLDDFALRFFPNLFASEIGAVLVKSENH